MSFRTVSTSSCKNILQINKISLASEITRLMQKTELQFLEIKITILLVTEKMIPESNLTTMISSQEFTEILFWIRHII